MKEKIQRTFVNEEAYKKLRDWIVDGTLEPGIPLRDKELAEKMGVSRTPIREALIRLESEGLVQTKPNCSTLVSPIDMQGAFHLYLLVGALERLALKQSFEFITNEHIELLNQTNERFLQNLKNRDHLAAMNADHDFHSIFTQLSNNQELQKVLSELKYKLRRLDIYYFEKTKDTLLSYEEHKQMITALKRKDLPAALDAVERNWEASFLRIKI